MMGFSGREILLSALYAMIYGFTFSLAYEMVIIFSRTLKFLPNLIREIICAEKVLPSPSIKERIKSAKEGGTFAFFSVFLFFIGFLLLSYFSLDGQLRLYMMIIASAAFYIFNSAFCVVLRGLFTILFDTLVLAISTVIRILLLPIKRFVLSLKIRKNRKKQ